MQSKATDEQYDSRNLQWHDIAILLQSVCMYTDSLRQSWEDEERNIWSISKLLSSNFINVMWSSHDQLIAAISIEASACISYIHVMRFNWGAGGVWGYLVECRGVCNRAWEHGNSLSNIDNILYRKQSFTYTRVHTMITKAAVAEEVRQPCSLQSVLLQSM